MGNMMCGVMSAEGVMFVAFIRDKKQAGEFMQLFGAPGVFITAYKDLHDLQKSIDENDPENSALDSFSLELFEDISYIMAKHADPQGVPDTPDEWLDQFGTFSIYQVLPEIIELWGLNVQTQVESKKTSSD